MPGSSGKSAQELLLEFAQSGREEPFEEIARRYAGMVYNVAMQVTRDAHDAEDATQATFLTLAVHAKTEGKIRYVGPWLRKVSQRLALDIRRSKKRRTNREQRHAINTAQINGNGNGNGEVVRHDLTISNGLQLEELRVVMREELDKLPAKYRMPLILYYFGGLNPEQISKELRCKTSTLGVRLHRGRKMLAQSLSGRGVSINMVTVTLLLGGMVDGFIKDNLVHLAARAASHASTGGLAAQASVAPGIGLVRCVTSAIRLGRMKGLVATIVLIASCFAGAAQMLRKFDLVNLHFLEMLNPMQLIRPLLDRLVHPPAYSSASDSTPANDDIVGHVQPLTLNSKMSIGEDFVPLIDPQYVLGSIASVESERLMASKFDPSAKGAPFTVYAGNDSTFVRPGTFTPVITSANSARFTALTKLSTVNVQSVAPATARKFDAPSAPSWVIDRNSSKDSRDGSFAFSSGTLHLNRLVVGDRSAGTFNQTGGVVDVDTRVVVAQQTGSAGTYSIAGAAILKTPQLIVGGAGDGTFVQNGGLVDVRNESHTGQLTLGDLKGSTGNYTLNTGTLQADTITVGNNGKGVLSQYGGTTQANDVVLGQGGSGKGTWYISKGNVQVSAQTGPNTVGIPSDAADSPVPISVTSSAITIGVGGAGTVLLNSPDIGATISEMPGAQGSVLYVRATATGQGTLRGFGVVQITGPVVQNGKVIADGFGSDRSLDLSSAQIVVNTIDNSAIDGRNGWYARQGGSLLLPAIDVAPDKTFTWGEDQQDTTLDLVNSVRFTPHGQGSGEVKLSLLDSVDNDAPALPGGRQALALWKLDSSMDMSSIDLLVRYDSAMLSVWRASEGELALWEFDGAWRPITDSSAGIDANQNLIWATAEGNPTYFATALLPDDPTVVSSSDSLVVPSNPLTLPLPVTIQSTPEPAISGFVVFSLAGLLFTRRRSR
ncbi:MAG TPA: RNA polymerase sigma factor [Tepidisphaeraceae bacterium]|nr:RNA polymerase sigma factor [Tepidisphaeraceae bacterium]